MQASHGGPRRKLNRNAFKLEHGPVPKRRRVSVSSSRSECTAPVADVHAEPSTARETSHAHQQEPSRATRNHEPSQCTLRDCNNNNISDNNEDDDNISASRRKEIRCHLHLALRCCFEKSASRADAEQSVSCTVSRLVNGDVRVETSSSTGDALEPHAVCAGKSGVKQEDTPVEAAEKKDGRAAHPSNQVLGFSVGEHILDVAEDVEGWSESSDKQGLRMPGCKRIKSLSVEGNECVTIKHEDGQRCVKTACCMAEESVVDSEVQEIKESGVLRVPPLLLRRVRALVPHQHFQHADLADHFTVGGKDKTQIDSLLAAPTLAGPAKDQSKYQKNQGASISSKGNCFNKSLSVFEEDRSRPGCVQKNNSQAVAMCFPMVTNDDTLNLISPDSITAVGTNPTFLEDDKNGTKDAIFHLPVPLPALQQNAFQTSSCLVHSREKQQTPTVRVPSTIEPQHPSLVMVDLKEEQKNYNDIKKIHECSLNVLDQTDDQSTFSPTCVGGSSWDTPLQSITNSDSFLSSEEDMRSQSPAERPEEGDAECLLLQEELCEIGKANASPSPLPAPKGSVVTAGDLDVVRAYEDDAIVLDVIQDDPDLFGAVMSTAENSSSKATSSPVQSENNRQMDQTPWDRKPNRIVWDLEAENPRNNVQTAADVYVENDGGFCREEIKGSEGQLTFGTKWTPVNPVVMQEQMDLDCNNNLDKKESTDLNVMTVNNGLIRQVDNAWNSVHCTAGKDLNIMRPIPFSYCRYYFSECYSCMRNMCIYLHVPRKEDEKFCMDVVQRFSRVRIPPIVQRAVEVFVAYYRTNSPGVSFSQNVVNQLLSSLLSLAMLKNLLTVINTLITHKRTPPPGFVMALYQHVRERRVLNFVPELILLTSKITEVGCVFTVEQCEMMQLHLESLHIPIQQMNIFRVVKCRALATNPHSTELSEMTQAVFRVELCKQQEDWPALARVFCAVFVGRHSAGELSRFCCCVTTALLKEPKDKLMLPYEPFAESVCQEVSSDAMVKSFLGRVGISLMFSYYRNQDWPKGLKLLCVMSRLQVEFAMLKGLFNNENGTSRCQLITIATEFFLNSGSIEGALNMLKANEWFVSSSAWPCDLADIQNRRKILTLLAEKTSYRDTLEVLTNLPGLKQPVDGVQAVEYDTVFNAHLQRCVTNQVLPVAADTLEFMLTQGIPPDASELQHLIHKLGKQNSWIRARTLFKRAHSAGYYSGVVCEKDCLILPCCLTEIEMTLAFEMFIARICSSLQNPSDFSLPLLITLKRRAGTELAMESEYLAAGSRLLSAAMIPNPKLSIRYTAVSQEQEQLFNLDRGSAAKWLSHNRSWAQGMWGSLHTHTNQSSLSIIKKKLF
ncbi:protein TOPAZ1 [Clarias gariepinus]|uniref:protein TOPAZ1 n=1 Tax=Clarias gariepinus TaxID=13013 RepID=UPI00234CA6F3|nr:protein TOPAZ1 [Clarias gariepinus]